MPVLYPGNPNQFGGVQETSGTVSWTFGTAPGITGAHADPVYAVPYGFWNNNGAFTVTASGGAASASITIQLLPAFASVSNPSVWTVGTATTNQARISVTMTAPAAGTNTASASGFGGGAGGAATFGMFPMAPYAQHIVSANAGANISATINLNCLMHWRR